MMKWTIGLVGVAAMCSMTACGGEAAEENATSSREQALMKELVGSYLAKGVDPAKVESMTEAGDSVKPQGYGHGTNTQCSGSYSTTSGCGGYSDNQIIAQDGSRIRRLRLRSNGQFLAEVIRCTDTNQLTNQVSYDAYGRCVVRREIGQWAVHAPVECDQPGVRLTSNGSIWWMRAVTVALQPHRSLVSVDSTYALARYGSLSYSQDQGCGASYFACGCDGPVTTYSPYGSGYGSGYGAPTVRSGCGFDNGFDFDDDNLYSASRICSFEQYELYTRRETTSSPYPSPYAYPY